MLLNMYHTSLSVRDMEENLEFFCGVLGMTIDVDTILSGKGLDEVVRLKDTRMRLVWLNAASGPQLELLQYLNPPGLDLEYDDNAIRVTHICFEVEDVYKAYERVAKHGIRVIKPPGDPMVGGPGALDGYLAFHLLSPDGYNIELKQKANSRRDQ